MTHPVRYLHNTRNPRLRYTVAYTFKNTQDGNLEVAFGIAQCNRKYDQYNRAEGREIAEARLNMALNGIASADNVPKQGYITIKDAPGLSVGRAVAQHYEAARNEYFSRAAASKV